MFRYLEHFNGTCFVRTPHLLTILILHTTYHSDLLAVSRPFERPVKETCAVVSQQFQSWFRGFTEVV